MKKTLNFTLENSKWVFIYYSYMQIALALPKIHLSFFRSFIVSEIVFMADPWRHNYINLLNLSQLSIYLNQFSVHDSDFEIFVKVYMLTDFDFTYVLFWYLSSKSLMALYIRCRFPGQFASLTMDILDLHWLNDKLFLFITFFCSFFLFHLVLPKSQKTIKLSIKRGIIKLCITYKT